MKKAKVFNYVALKANRIVADVSQRAISEWHNLQIKFGEKSSPVVNYIEGNNFNKLWHTEWIRYIRTRRSNRPNSGKLSSIVKPTAHLGLVGLALSGGGIRSAAFNLGVLQALADLKLLKYVDYLSTVSGGGYIGSCLTAHLHHQGTDVALENESFPFASPKSGEERLEVRHLRNKSKYLGPRQGLSSVYTWRLLGSYLGSVFLLLPIPLAALVLIAGLFDFVSLHLDIVWHSAGPFWNSPPIWTWNISHCKNLQDLTKMLCFVDPQGELIPPGLPSLFMHAAMVSLVLFGVALGVLLLSTRRLISQRWQDDITEALAATLGVMLVGFVLGLFPTAVQLWVENAWRLSSAFWPTSSHFREISGLVVSLITLLLTFLANREWEKPWAKAIKLSLIKVFVSVFLISIGLTLIALYRTHPNAALWASGITFFIGWKFLDPDRISLHLIYRDLLTNAFVVKQSPGGFVAEHSLRLAELCGPVAENRVYRPPYQLLNAAINLAGDRDPSLRDRKAALFVFSPFFCGSQRTGWRATETYESGRMDLATAMAISGAAVSPQMGMYTNRSLAMLMTLLNIRLGSWRENPRFIGSVREGTLLGTLFSELLGKVSSDTRYINLSDGGHFENLGVYSLIQRRCRYIIVSDAGADEKIAFSDLGNALRKIRIDLGVKVEPCIALLKPNPESGFSLQRYAICEIEYPDEKEKGLFVYLKPTICGDEPADILAYRNHHKSFPHEPTRDQFFGEAQFESYRILGYHTVNKIFEPARSTIQKWESQKRTGTDVVGKVFEKIHKHWRTTVMK